MRAWLACLALLPPVPLAAADDPALAVVDACRAKLDPRTDVGLERIEKRCPELMPAIEKAPWYGLVPRDLRARRDELSAEGLRALAELVRGASRESAPRSAPDVGDLAPVLQRLGQQGQEGATRWERFKRWLQAKFERRKEQDDEESWLKRLGRQFETSAGVARAITYTGYVLLGALVVLVVYTELRAAGVFGRRRQEARPASGTLGARRRLTLDDVAQAPLADRPGLLLRLLGEALTRTERLPAPEGLTATAIARQARLEEPDDHRTLRTVATVADAVRYGPTRPPDEKLRTATQLATSLLTRLASPRRGRR